ncbi:hypothetical protein [Oceanicaulis sp. MMSF_3324]|uniref:hypothetical protein n=1 Tax=Oceanicaulis sp. MMSF_3324 TaxID=3046702 RepID=UPI00273E909B|nr:hypothetical protein [Oceanicaulis sp. MMSF_3324]
MSSETGDTQGRLHFVYHEDRDILEVAYPSIMDPDAVAEAMRYMQTGRISSQGRALIDLSNVEEITLTSEDLVRFANERARDFGDRSRTRQFNAFYGVSDKIHPTVDAWTRFFPTGGGPVEMRLFEERHDAVYWLMGRKAQPEG